MTGKWKSLACLALLFGAAQTLRADGTMLNGVSPRSIGRGGTNIAFADNGAVLLDNPAGAVNIEGKQLFDIGLDVLITDFHYSNPVNPYAQDNTGLPLPAISLIRRSDDGQWAYGLGVYAPAGFSEHWRLEGPYPLLGSREYWSFGSLVKVLPGVAYRIDDRLTFGATLGVAVSHEELKGPYFLQGPSALAGTPLMLATRGTGAAMCWSTGFQYAVTDATRLGLTYQSESRFHLDGPATVDVPGLGQSDYDVTTDMTWPQSLGLGVRHELCPHRILSADVIWYNWSTAYNVLGMHFDHPSNPYFPAIYEETPLRWTDSVSTRLGYEHVLEGGQVLRFGYVYSKDPIPNGTLTPFLQAMLEHSFSTGLGWKWGEWDVDLAYMFSFSAQHEVAHTDFLGGDFDHSTHSSQVHALCVSLMHSY